MKKWALLGLLVVLVAVGAAAYVGMTRRIELTAPAGGPPAAPSPGPVFVDRESSIFVPARVTIAALHQAAEHAVPHRVNGSQDNPLPNPMENDRLDWWVTRKALTMRAANGRLALAAPLHGQAQFRGSLRPVGGDIGRMLGRLRPSIPISMHADLSGKAVLFAAPRLLPDWHIDPRLSGNITIDDASIPVPPFGRISVRGEAQKAVDRLRDDLVEKLAADLRSNDGLRAAAVKLWGDVARVVRLDAEGQPLWLAIEPAAIVATQPAIRPAEVEIGLGVRARLRLTSGQSAPATPQPAFPSSPELVARVAPGGFHLRVPAAQSWESLNEALAREVAGHDIAVPGEILAKSRVHVREISARADGAGIQVRLDFETRSEGWFTPTIEGVIWLRGTPVLDTEKQQLHITDLGLATATRDLLPRAALWLAAPTMLATLQQNMTVDLTAPAAEARARVEAALNRLGTLLPEGLRAESRVDRLVLTGLTVGQDALYLLLEADGRLVLGPIPLDTLLK